MKAETKLLHAGHTQNAIQAATGTVKAAHSHFATRTLILLFALLLFACGTGQSQGAPAISDQAPAARITLAIFHDRPMADDLWQALVSSLHEELASSAAEAGGAAARTTGADPSSMIQIVRGDEFVPGTAVDKSITVYLQGECKTTPTPPAALFGQPQPWRASALGWVNMVQGHIEPFIHVDCKRIGQMLGQQGIGRSVDVRNQMMANAIARVVTHEWIHVATQSPHHSKRGVSKAEFGVADLLQEPSKSIMEYGTGARSADRDSGSRMAQSSAPAQSNQACPLGTK